MLKATTTLFITLLMSFSVLAHGQLGQIMRDMSATFHQAAQAKTVESMKKPITEMSELVEKAKQEKHDEATQQDYQIGLEKLSTTLDEITEELDKNDLDGAKQLLRRVDALRSEYHKKTR